MRNIFLSALLTCIVAAVPISLYAQDSLIVKSLKEPIQKFYVGSSLDGAIFSSAMIAHTGTTPALQTTNSMGTLRFSWFLNLGLTFNLNFGRHVGAYTGIDLKNIGYIEKNNDASTSKRRTYNIGAPLGFKFGNMARRKGYVFMGGGMDVPVNYKEKKFVERSQKDVKLNEWFSQRTPAIMPYLFAGGVIRRGVTFKAQYYPDNFLNPGFTKNGIQPYAGADIHLVLFSIGLAIRYGRHMNIEEPQTPELKIM